MNTTTHTNSPALVLRIEGRIQVIRGLRVMIDADLAELYGVPTKVLNQAVKRNGGRFPPDFMFQLDASEKTEVVTNCDHLSKCRIPDDCIDSKRYPLFMAREVMRQLIDNLCVTTAVHPGALS